MPTPTKIIDLDAIASRANTVLAKHPTQIEDKWLWRIKPANVFDFTRHFMGRRTENGNEPSEKQWETLVSSYGEEPLPQQKLGVIDGFFHHRLLVLVVGQGGGKNFVTEIDCAYATYLWQCLSNPHYSFQIDASRVFNIINFSQVNKEQGRRVFFDHFKRALKETREPRSGANWFEKHVLNFNIDRALLKDEFTIPCSIPGNGPLVAWSGDSGAATPEGSSIWKAIIDEPSRANSPAKYSAAKNQYNVIDGNRNTRFIHELNSQITVFSYPEQEVNDLTIELHNKHKDDPLAHCVTYTTFEFDPRKKPTDPQYAQAFKDDPIDANRRYNCIVPKNVMGFFQPWIEKIKECANPNRANRANYHLTTVTRTIKKFGQDAEADFTIIDMDSLEIMGDDKERVMFIDPGKNGDAFAIACGFPTPLSDVGIVEQLDRDLERESAEYKTQSERMQDMEAAFKMLSAPVIDTLIVAKPQGGAAVDFANADDVIWALIEAFPNIVGVHFDHWQSDLFVDQLRADGVPAENHQFSNPVQVRLYKTLRRFVWNNQAEYLYDERAIREMERLIKVNENKVDHPEGPGESKDIADTFAGCAYFICQLPPYEAPVGAVSNSEYLNAYRYLKRQLGHEPTKHDIAVLLGVDMDQVENAQEAAKLSKQDAYQKWLAENSDQGTVGLRRELSEVLRG